MTLTQILVDVAIELDEVTHGQSFSPTELLEYANQQYEEWVVNTKCITKTAVNQAWWSGCYFDFPTTFTDAVGIYTIFNHQTNRYLFDHMTRFDLDKMRIDWEVWNGTPVYWCPISHNKIAVAPNYFPSPVGLYDITYWAFPAPLALSDSPLFSSDMHFALEDGIVARALESVEEFKKAAMRFKGSYQINEEKYRKRIAASHNSEMRRIMGG